MRKRNVAIKTVRATKVTEVTIKEFMKELQIMAPLRHPNLVTLFGGCWDDGPDKLCLVLEFCARGSISDLFVDKSNTWAEPYHRVVLGIALCFRYLHHEQADGKALIHRDLKPDNVLLTNELVPKVADFGESTRCQCLLA